MTPRQWAVAVLQKLGFQPTTGGVQALVGWARAEGGNSNGARFNYLNTTQGAPGASNVGTQGDIKSYTSWDQGINATVKTLKNGNYGDILAGLKAGDAGATARAIGASPWGTNGHLVQQTIAETTVTKVPHVLPSPGGSSSSGAPQLGDALSQGDPFSPGAQAAPSTPVQAVQPQIPQSALPAPATAPQVPLPAGYRGIQTSGPPPNLQAQAQSALTPQDLPGQNTSLQTPADTVDTGSSVASPEHGAAAALSWARSKIGFKEATGNNDGGLAAYANSRFGLKNAPWCAMFTSLAVTKGGAPLSARTASVAVIRQQAVKGGGGYEKGFIKPADAQPGDLILFGNDHVGMIESVSDGKIKYVGGNQSNGVTEATTSAGNGDIVRPKYGARK